ncbi:hypothetical protein AB0C29_09860 [Actinoplanes sp. NPDC048791]|uniref:hypothetical protein n=1 Tax=Actinoplanes sp. NPDC048791 TaxID=3154623 RepID=UPI0033CBDE0D
MPEPIETLVNREQQLDPEEMAALTRRLDSQLEALALTNDVEGTEELADEEVRARRDLFRATFADARIDTEKLFDTMIEIQRRHHTGVADALERALDIKRRLVHDRVRDWDLHLPAPEPPDFWWAFTQPFDTSGHTMDWRNDGLHIFGGPKINKWNVSRNEVFGATARFTITGDRFPREAPPSGWWVSRPFVELFGGVVGFAPDWDLLQGHGMASCRLHLRHTVFQLGFGQNGPVPVILGEAVSDRTLLDLEDLGYSRHAGMPGFTPLPEVRFPHAGRAVADTVFAEVEVRFDIHLKAEGALVWCDPEILLRNFQWPLAPLP